MLNPDSPGSGAVAKSDFVSGGADNIFDLKLSTLPFSALLETLLEQLRRRRRIRALKRLKPIPTELNGQAWIISTVREAIKDDQWSVTILARESDLLMISRVK